MDKEVSYIKDGYMLRLAKADDLDNYYNNNFNPLDKDVSVFTGCKKSFSYEEIKSYLEKCINSKDRADFFIVNPFGVIIGESVLNEIDFKEMSANFRITIFNKEERNKKIGSWAVKETIKYGFENLKLNKITLNVFSFNINAKRTYLLAGFKTEKVIKDSVIFNGNFCDEILMTLNREMWLLNNVVQV